MNSKVSNGVAGVIAGYGAECSAYTKTKRVGKSHWLHPVARAGVRY